MLSGLRTGTPVFLLYKNEPRFAVAKVVVVSQPYPPFSFGASAPMTGQAAAAMHGNTVDITVEVDGKNELFPRVPLSSTIVELPDKGLILSETKDGIINEINVIRSASEAAIGQVEAHKQIIESCDSLLLELNPQLRKEQEQSREIATLKSQLTDVFGRFDAVNDQLAALTGMLSKTLGKKKDD